MNRHQFDIADIEEIVQQEIAAVVEEKLYEEKLYEIQKQTAAVCVASSHDRTKYHDLEDFSISEDKKICKLVNNHHHEFQTSTIQLIFEIKMNCEALKIKKKSAFNSKMSAKRNDKIQSSSVSEKNSTPAEKSKH